MKRIKTVKTAEEFIRIKCLGTYEDDYKNGELWSFNGKLYYLSHLELNMNELLILNYALNMNRID